MTAECDVPFPKKEINKERKKGETDNNENPYEIFDQNPVTCGRFYAKFPRKKKLHFPGKTIRTAGSNVKNPTQKYNFKPQMKARVWKQKTF